MIDITCIVNCHRESHLVNPTIKSVGYAVEQAEACGLAVEVLIVLDKSDDATNEVATRHVSDQWKTCHYEFGDLSLARNAAVDRAEGKYIAFIDGDDLWCSSWLTDCYLLAESRLDEVVLHPEYNIYFGAVPHVLKHVDMESSLFEIEYLKSRNYWTALSFAASWVYKRFPYIENKLDDGFGYEDWTWNGDTIRNGLIHKVVPGTAHFIRRGKTTHSLLDATNQKGALPKVLDIYSRKSEQKEALV